MIKGCAVLSMLAVVVAMTAACTHQADSAPPLAGPSQLAMAVTMTANPDRISLDGGSQSLVTVQVRGPNGQVQVNVPLRVDMVVNGVVQDYGKLNARNIVTGTDGNAFVVYTAPALAAGANQPFSTVSIQAIIVGTDAAAAVTHAVIISLVQSGVILPPADTPTASFVVTPTPVSLNVAASFDASGSCPGAKNTVGCLPSSSAVITNYAWSFGDGATTSGKTVNHTFAAIGTYNVTLTITNDRGIVNSTSQSIVVSAPVASPPPTASFTFSPAAPAVNEVVHFNAGASAPGAGHSIASFLWNFGDGSTGSGVAPDHTYVAAGSYSVQLRVTDEDGQSATAAQSIVPGSPPAPTANFTFSPATPGRFDQIVFDASSSSTAQGQTIVDVAWNFGDGTPIIHCPGGSLTDCPGPTNRISTHTFQLSTSFVINLVVTDSAGRIGSHNTSITIALGDPTVSATSSPGSPIAGSTVFFSSNGTTYFPGSGPASFAWTFGDGGTSAAPNPTHVYSSVGTYSVGLAVTDNKGRTGVGSASVSVVAVTPPTPPAPPVAAFTFSAASFVHPATVNFDAGTSTSPSGAAITNYRWNFGDGTPIVNTASVTTNHVYNAAGAYTVSLIVTTGSNGLTGSTTGAVTIQ
jgi:PKD repeat protein